MKRERKGGGGEVSEEMKERKRQSEEGEVSVKVYVGGK